MNVEDKQKRRLATVRRLIKQQGAKRTPSVDGVDPEVRTDSSLPVTAGAGVKDLGGLIRSGAALGVYIVEWGYDVPQGKWAAFHRWLNANERKLAASAPKGTVAYKGTVVAVFGPSHRADGRYRTFWALSSLESAEHFSTKGGATFRTLVKGLLSFRDSSSGSGFSQLYQIAAGAAVY
jgi:hypothetical protein